MKQRTPLRPGELGFAALLVAGSLYAFRESFAISGVSGLTTGGVMPMLAAGIMALSGLFILGDALVRRSGWRPDIAAVTRFLVNWRLLAVTALIALFALAVPKFGFVMAASGFLFITMSLLWRGRFLRSAAITALSMASIYVLFRLVFKVVLPQGTFWQ